MMNKVSTRSSPSLTESFIMPIEIHRVAFLRSRVQYAQESSSVHFIPAIAPRRLFPYYWHTPPVIGSTGMCKDLWDGDYPRVARNNSAVKGITSQVHGYALSP